jgi:diguanylate cyclase (GGDEF)-like protein
MATALPDNWLVSVMQQAGGALSLDEGLHAILDSMKDFCPGQSAAILLLDDKTKTLHIRVSRHLSFPFVKAFARSVHGSAVEQVILGHKPILFNQPSPDSPVYHDIKLEHDFTAAALVPVIKMQRGIGYLYADRLDATFSEEDLQKLHVVGLLAGSLIEKFDLIQTSRQLSTIDPSSRTLHYRAFVPALATEMTRARTQGYPLTLALVAVDAYRRCLEEQGIDNAHALLAETAAVIQQNLHDTDLLARYSADQFILCLTKTPHAEAMPRLEAIRDTVATKVIPPDGQPAVSSIGALTLTHIPSAAGALGQILAALGHALMQARLPPQSGICLAELAPQGINHG